MVGSLLSRVLPVRTKAFTNSSTEQSLDEKMDYFSQTPKITTLEPNESPMTKPNVHAANPTMMHTSSRKHSYASIKEDSEIPQSFRTRRLTSDSSPRLSQSSLRRPSFDGDVAQRLAECLEEDEIVVIDEESDCELVARSSDDSHDTYLRASRRQPASLETMPEEILDLIFSLVTLDVSKERHVYPRADVFSCLQVSKSIHAAALRVLYRHVKIFQSKTFFNFLNGLAADPHLGELVQCLDFSHYSNIGFGRTRTTHTQVPYLTPTTLKACLDNTKNLKAFLVHEHVDDELDFDVLTKLFQMPSMRALDLCSCSSKAFATTLADVCTRMPSWLGLGKTMPSLSIERLSLHECTTLRTSVFEALLPRLARLTHLDIAHTMVDDKALLSIPSTARITHLNLERCTQITGAAVVKFVTQHPAVKNTIVYLNLMADASRYRLLSEDELSQLLPQLPSTLRSLNIGGARINNTHVRSLRALSTHLEELGLKGANLGFSGDITHILSLTGPEAEKTLEHPEWKSSLRYLDLTDIKSVSKMSLNYSPTTITGKESVPLEVIELSPGILNDLNKSIKKPEESEWVVRELGRRGWFVRQMNLLPASLHTPDDGYRTWKMGARWWGMRKIPMFEQDTGGMYGYFMFKRS